MSKMLWHDKGVSPTVAEADRMMAAMPKWQIKDDTDHRDVKWHEFEFGSMRGQYRLIGKQIDLLSLINTQPHNGHFNRLLKYASRRHRIVRVLHPHERLKAYLIRSGFVVSGDHVISTTPKEMMS